MQVLHVYVRPIPECFVSNIAFVVRFSFLLLTMSCFERAVFLFGFWRHDVCRQRTPQPTFGALRGA